MNDLWARVRQPPRWLVLLLVALALEAAYVFFITAGTFTTWPTWTANYNLQAEGFRAGHLYLPIAPAPELLAQRNPYDWSNVRYWFWDASLYKGHYYLYWGPFPALALAAIKIVFRMKVEIADQFPVFAFYSLYLAAGVLLIDRMARRLFPALPLGWVVLGIVVYALSTPTPYIVATPGVYQAAIIGAQAFMVLGLVFAFDALWRRAGQRAIQDVVQDPAGDGTPPRWLPLLLAGLCWGIAITIRASAGPPILFFCLATVAAAGRTGPGRWKGRVRDFAWMAAPVAVLSFALLAYNKARFESWLEFGVTYQLNTVPFIQSVRFIHLNVWSYLFRPLGSSCHFPFVFALRNIGQRGFPSWLTLPPNYATIEPLAGLFITAPWTWLSGVAAGISGVAAVRRLRTRGARPPLTPQTRLRTWCVFCFAMLATLTFLPMLAGNATTIRYLSDVSTGFLLASIWGAWMLREQLQNAKHVRPGALRIFLAVCLLLAIATLILAVLLGFQGYDETFKNHNPALYLRMVRSLSFCAR